MTIGKNNAPSLLLPKCHRATKHLLVSVSVQFSGSTLVSSLAWCYHPRSLRPEGKG